MYPKVVHNLFDMLNKKHGKESSFNVTQVKLHEYLEMTIDFSITGKVLIRSDEFFKKLLEELREYMEGTVMTSTVEHLFKVRDILSYTLSC